MIIRKSFKFNGMHIVRNCSTERCKKSIHAHTYQVEVFLTADGLDNGQMIVDFGLLKGHTKGFISAFDNSYSLWDRESEGVKSIHKKLERYVVLPFSPSAESYSLLFLNVFDKLLKATQFNNGEKNPRIVSVRVHETTTGYAEAFIEDLEWVKYQLKDIKFSPGIYMSWYQTLSDHYDVGNGYDYKFSIKPCFINPVVDQQICM